MAGFRVEGNTTGNVAEVTANNELQVALGKVEATVGYAITMSEIDPGTVNPDGILLRSPETSPDFRIRAGMDTLLFDYFFGATAQDTGAWKHDFDTMTMTQSGGYLLANANSNQTTLKGCAIRTWRHFAPLGTAPVCIEATLQVTALPVLNQICEFGLFIPATVPVLPTDGAYWRINSTGIYGEINYNTSVTTTPLLIAAAAIPLNTATAYVIVAGERSTEFWINDVLYAVIPTPATSPQSFMTDSLPIALQFRNGGAVGSAGMQTKLGHVSATLMDLNTSKIWMSQMTGMGRAHQGLAGGTMGAIAAVTNSQAIGAGGALVNTTAIAAGLGGQVAISVTAAQAVDGVMCAYLNPVGGINQPPRTLVITGIHIQSAVTTALSAAAVVHAYQACWGHIALALTQTESATFTTATTKIPRRMPLGMEAFAASAAVGVLGGGVHISLNAPITVNPGEYFEIVAKNLGAGGGTGVITAFVGIDHYFE